MELLKKWLKAGVHEDAKSTAERTVVQSVKQNFGMLASLERRRMEGSSLQAEVMQKVPELVAHERMVC